MDTTTPLSPRGLVAALLIAAAAALTGCASLPAPAPRPASTAIVDTADTPLAHIAAASARGAPVGLSGFRLLPAGDQAFDARIALARRAVRTLDVQYYQVAADTAGLQFLRELRDAAARGVRVRLLIDDLHAAADDRLLLALAAHPNIELRLFNPLPVRSGSVRNRVLLSMHEFGRVNRRMHNKLFVADDRFAIAGGRNIADEYFMRNASGNFIDIDVLMSGPVVRELSAVFDRYWNSEPAYPLASVARGASEPAVAQSWFEGQVHNAPTPEPATSIDALGRSPVGTQLAAGRVERHFAPVRVFADTPTKATQADTFAPDTSALATALSVMGSARHEVVVASPYFIPGARGMTLMRAAVAGGVRVSVLTNSLAATDEPLVHWAYTRYRDAMLQLGVELQEVGPVADRAPGAPADSSASLGRLHAKVAVLDRCRVLIGSMNMDARSARSNTEIGLVIDSAALAGETLQLLGGAELGGRYRLRRTEASEGIEWVGVGAGGGVVHADEPHASWALRLKLGLLSLFVDEDLL